MPLEWIICGREERLPEPELLVAALAPTGAHIEDASPPPSEAGGAREAIRLRLAFERCDAELEFRLTREGVSPPSADLSPDVLRDLSASRIAARLTVELPRGRERHGVLFAIRVVSILADHLEGPLLDVLAHRAWRVAEVRNSLEGRAFEVKNHVRVDVRRDDQDRVWLSTRGLHALGQPDLMLPGVRAEHRELAETLLYFVADQEIGRAELEPGALRAFGRAAITFMAPAAYFAAAGAPYGEAGVADDPRLILVPTGPSAAPSAVAMDMLMLSLAAEARGES